MFINVTSRLVMRVTRSYVLAAEAGAVGTVAVDLD